MAPNRRRELLSDVAIAAATAAWPLLLAQEVEAGTYTWPTGGRLAVEIAATLVALLLLWWRRRHPVGVAIAILPVVVSAFAVVPAFVALYAVAAYRRWTVATVVAVGYLGVSLGAAAVFDPPEAWWPRILMLAAFHAVPVAFGMVRNARLALLRELEDRATRAETEQQMWVDRARRLERQRIAREMHDVVAHRISLVSLHAGALSYRSDATPDEVADAAEVIRTSANEALEELRDVIAVLRDAPDDVEPEPPQPTLADLPVLLERCRATGARLTVREQPVVPSLPTTVERTAYRVIEEGLTNAAKHAPGSTVEVAVGPARHGGVEVEVANLLPIPHRDGDGEGARAGVPGSGAGLVGLVERVALAGGDLTYGPTEDGRFRLRAEIPWVE
jgi:signal transduction histidine kinase